MRFLANNGEDVLFGKDQEVLVIELELCASVLGEEHFVSNLHIHRNAIAIIVAAAIHG